MQFSVGDGHLTAMCYNCRQRGTGFSIRWQLFGDHCQKWGLPINSLFQFPSSSGDDQSYIFHHQASDTVIFWKWDKSIWLSILKMMFGIFSSKCCHCSSKVSYLALMAQSTGLKYFSWKNFSSCGGNVILVLSIWIGITYATVVERTSVFLVTLLRFQFLLFLSKPGLWSSVPGNILPYKVNITLINK